MKKYTYYPVIILFLLVSCSTDSVGSDSQEEELENTPPPETTAIADPAFEQALIDLNFDEELDGEILNSRITIVTSMILDDKGITNLSGIANFVNLENLSVRQNQLTAIDVSKNTKLKFLWAEDNQLSQITLNSLSVLEKVGADRNELTSIDVADNIALQLLTVSNNQLTTIDVSANNELTQFIVSSNPLDCIKVNQTQLNAIPLDWSKDEADSYTLECN